jgi:hypothetical protein
MSRRLAQILLSTAAVAAAASMAFAVTPSANAAESDWPRHSYIQTNCADTGYWGRYIVTQPLELATFPGVGVVSFPGPSGPYAYMHQYIYYRLWVYSYGTGQWSPSPYKRLTNGVIASVSEFNTQFGRWMDPAGDITNSPNLNIGTREVGVRVGSGWHYVMVETYWEQPTTEWNYSNPAPAAGWRHFDFLRYCYFGASGARSTTLKTKRPVRRPALPRGRTAPPVRP